MASGPVDRWGRGAGLTVLLDITVPQPVWRGPIKGTLGDEECGDDVAQLVQAWLGERFEAEPAIAAQVLDHVFGRSITRG